jgi:predicted hotdog family 3-hydroxylacyl-ACP dehydratase
MLTADDIAKLIPHGRNMSLVESIDSWDNNSIRCSAKKLFSAENPLCENGSLDNLTLIEYAAQAVAVHLSLSCQAISRPRPGYVGAVKDVFIEMPVRETSGILICANCLLKNSQGAVYTFNVTQEGNDLISGKIYLNYLNQ